MRAQHSASDEERRSRSASTAGLLLSVMFASMLWIFDATLMSLYWVARLPIDRSRKLTSTHEEARGSDYGPLVRSGNRRNQKIALSIAIVGALVAPFAFGTYKARPTYSVWVPLAAQEKEDLAINLLKRCQTRTTVDIGGDIICNMDKQKFELGGEYEHRPLLLKYLSLNVGAAAATFASVYVFAFLIPMLVRGLALLVRRYRQWLSA